MTDSTPLLTFMIGVGAIAATLWVFFYSFRPWWVTAQGWALMVKSVANMLLLNMAMAFQLFGDYPYREQVRTVVFGLFLVGIFALLGALLFSPGAKRYPPWSWGCR